MLGVEIAGRIGRALERRGLVERDLENAWLATDTQAGPLDDLLGHSITYRIAVGPRAGQKLFTLQTASGQVRYTLLRYARQAVAFLSCALCRRCGVGSRCPCARCQGIGLAIADRVAVCR